MLLLQTCFSASLSLSHITTYYGIQGIYHSISIYLAVNFELKARHYQCVSQKVAQAIDAELMSSSGGFSIDQLMELGKKKYYYYFINKLIFCYIDIAGLSVAQAVEKSFDHAQKPNVLVCVGPGRKKKH
jgi:hypothetical protein